MIEPEHTAHVALEEHVQTPTADQAGATPVARAPADDPSGTALMPAEGSPQGEEVTVLLAGFLTGLTIAGVFLIYIVLESAKLLP